MAEIYFPIEGSPLKEVIPSGEDILYSTLAHIIRVHKTSRTEWDAHVLLTPEIVAFTEPKGSRFVFKGTFKSTELLLRYYEWYQMKRIMFGKVLRGAEYYMSKDDPKYTKSKVTSKFKLIKGVFINFIRDPNFETKENFKQRCYLFPLKFIPIAIESKKKLSEAMKKYPESYSRSDKKRCEKEIINLEADLIKAKQKLTKKGITF